MIRALLADIFPSRAQVGALRQRVHELERENARLQNELWAADLAIEFVRADLDAARRECAAMETT